MGARRRGLSVVVGVFAVLCSAALQGEELKVGDRAPSFKLPGTDGKMHDLKDYLGRQVVVLAWFPKAFTSGCTAECKSMRDSGKAIRQYDAAYFTASCDTPEINKKFADSLALDFPILSDPDKEVAKAYGVVDENQANPARWTFYIGADGKILAIDKQVKTGQHGEDIARKLQELGVPKR
jgi:peroxiredoxin Q/BCP